MQHQRTKGQLLWIVTTYYKILPSNHMPPRNSPQKQHHHQCEKLLFIQLYKTVHWCRRCGRSSIIINNNIPHSEITLNTNMQAVAISATLHETITVYSVYIPPNEEPKELELNNLIEQLPRPFIIMGDFNSHNEIRRSKKIDKKGKVIESLLNQHQLCMYNNKSNTYLHPTTGTYFAIDLSICDPSLFLDYNWQVHDDTCGTDYLLILLEDSTDELSKRTPSWNLGKSN